MDALSDLLSTIVTRNAHYAGLQAGGEWAVDFPAPSGLKFVAVVTGECLLQVVGEVPVLLSAGDCFLLAERKPFRLASDMLAPTVDAASLFAQNPDGVARLCGSDVFLIGGEFDFCEEIERAVGELEPATVVRDGTSEAPVIRWALDQLSRELAFPSLGTVLMRQHLGQILLLQVLRVTVSRDGDRPPGWLGALRDEKCRKAIEAIHDRPHAAWSVESLAAAAGVSRSTFAFQFKKNVGMAPLEYVIEHRMRLARRHLRQSERPISWIAEKLGYVSDSAFSSAFKRSASCSPTDYRKRARNDPGSEVTMNVMR
ncbi:MULTISPECIES: AraC family transcriptional regulator [Burkholderiaceae]|uniref:AraC family transcriptional regulator n=1 Tax=Burkholderiaceae TaxID=119060 RepID=UPI00074B7CEA|nr:MULTISPECIES: AraC family transcriptional regulator [Burkholderiaceae]SAL77730.1 AraC family transcriptional regulator [Caballeronia peredens]